MKTPKMNPCELFGFIVIALEDKTFTTLTRTSRNSKLCSAR